MCPQRLSLMTLALLHDFLYHEPVQKKQTGKHNRAEAAAADTAIETSFRALKYTIGLANFHSKKAFFVAQEVFARLTFFNFCKMISSIVERSLSEKYHTNFSLAVMLCRRFMRKQLHECILMEKISRLILPIRPNRAFVRYQAHTYAVGFSYRVQYSFSSLCTSLSRGSFCVCYLPCPFLIVSGEQDASPDSPPLFTLFCYTILMTLS